MLTVAQPTLCHKHPKSQNLTPAHDRNAGTAAPDDPPRPSLGLAAAALKPPNAEAFRAVIAPSRLDVRRAVM